MKRSSLILFGSAVVLTLMTGRQVRADFISWTYDWHRNPIAVSTDDGRTGGISTHVDAAPSSGGGGGGDPHHAPEPSTLALSGLGLSFLGLVSWRKRLAAAI